MRDPWLGQGPDGTWHMVWTWGWTRADMGGRLKIGYTSSQDLIAWTPQRAIFVMDNEPEARNAWAPEAVWDAGGNTWTVFWASTIPGRFSDTDASGDGGYNHRIYATTTKDWQTFSPSRLWFDPGFNAIDATDWRTFEDITAHVSFPADHRHGTVVKISEELARRLRAPLLNR